eukprot:scaffold8353_cov138-Cylindrotheca_fusiformis.AAC.25
MGFGLLLHPQNRETGQKLGIATGLMFTAPILSFYAGLWYFSEKRNPDNWAGGLAIFVTNIIVAGYCFAAFMEEDNDADDSAGPRKGAHKQRTD